MSPSKIQSHNGTGGLHGLTMNVATLPELFTYRGRESRFERNFCFVIRLSTTRAIRNSNFRSVIAEPQKVT